jgi:subfamily B ATP-binding cassette protein MsbA
VDLVARFYDPTGGRILIDDVDLREFSTHSLRSQLGVVAQDTVLFHDTVRANIAYARPEMTDEAIERAARAANAHEFIEHLPEGYNTILGERATRLSGGQRQRLAIARAILRDPPILILDEATSALDSESERLVQDAMDKLLRGPHRVRYRAQTVNDPQRRSDRSNAKRPDRAARHARSSCSRKGGLYRHLYRLQFTVDDEVRLRPQAVEPV